MAPGRGGAGGVKGGTGGHEPPAPPSLTHHDDAEHEVADLLQQLGADGQQQPGHRLHPADGHQVRVRIGGEAKVLEGKDLGEADELCLLGTARGAQLQL